MFVKSMNNSFSEICTSPQYYDRILSKNEQFTVNSYCLQALKIGVSTKIQFPVSLIYFIKSFLDVGLLVGFQKISLKT